MNPHYPIAKLTIYSLRRFLSLSLILASMIFTVRLYEIVFVSNFQSYPHGSIVNLLIGFKYDLILYLRISALLMIPFLLIVQFSHKAARWFFIISSLLIVLINMMLLKYFSTARVPLGADLLGYSFNDMQNTVGASGNLKLFPFIIIALYIALMIRVFIKHVYFRLPRWAMALMTILMLCSLLPVKQFNPNPAKFDTEFSMFVADNKLRFFTNSITNHFLHQKNLDRTAHDLNKSAPLLPENDQFTYTHPDYPFLHTENTPDILGDYFNLGETPPNIVFIVVESLGRAYSGQGAYLGSFTPFLDSLMQKSLYWENCLSTSGRTFQVLPSILASLPFGERGFAEMGDKMPDHISLISLLKTQANYSSTFVYGGEAEFDNMDAFMNRQGVDKIIDSHSFGKGYTKLPAAGTGFSWGYGDKEIFRRYLAEQTTSDTSPKVDVLLTLAMHDPFLVPNQEYYEKKYVYRVNKLNLSDKTKLFDRDYPKQFASILYFDESLQYFFNEFKKRKSFDNTIFIITGDHRMPEIPISTQIDRFHVPLVIYSPMLKNAEKFAAVTTHFDIAPSVIAMLDAKNYITRPTVASWIGHGLDNSKSFRNLHTYPLMRNKNEILDLLSGNSFLANNSLYSLFPNLNIEPKNQSDTLNRLTEVLDNFIRTNIYACKNNKLIPDSLKKLNLQYPKIKSSISKIKK